MSLILMLSNHTYQVMQTGALLGLQVRQGLRQGDLSDRAVQDVVFAILSCEAR